MMTEMLRELGVSKNSLTAEEITQLDRDGYMVVRGVLPAEQAAKMAARLRRNKERLEGALGSTLQCNVVVTKSNYG